ncbi:MAG: signal peptidase I [Kiritimatiellae bacterium]|nr:signal peptidase I [Kiritimatiellia bacterium]
MASDIETEQTVPRFFMTRSFWLRTGLFALVAYLVFGWLCIPIHIRGTDMAPTYNPGNITFCWRPRFWISKPKPGDIVFVRVPKTKAMLLRRVIAISDDNVGFYHGTAVINGQPLSEPYVQNPCKWHFRPVPVQKKNIYVVGDNRDIPPEQAAFGAVETRQIIGAPLW